MKTLLTEQSRLKKIKELKQYLDETLDDIEFVFMGKEGSICPFSRTEIYLNYDNNEILVNDLNDIYTTPFLLGNKTLEDVIANIEILKW